jgi:hypothetical protein
MRQKHASNRVFNAEGINFSGPDVPRLATVLPPLCGETHFFSSLLVENIRWISTDAFSMFN